MAVDASASQEGLLDSIQTAIDAAHVAMLATQKADGSWHGVNDGGPFPTAWMLAFERYLDCLTERDCKEAVRYLRSQQFDDGSVPNWPGAEAGTLDGTLQWWAGMIAGRVPESDPAMVRARAWIEAHGGFAGGIITTRVVLAVAGVVDPSTLPRLPLFFKLIPGNVELIGKLLGVDWIMAAHLLPGIIRGLQNGGRKPNPLLHPIEALEYRALVDYMFRRQDPSGGWIGVAFETLIVAGMLVSLGVSRDDPRIQRALAYASLAKNYRADGLFVEVFVSDVWDTGQYIRGLVRTGLSGNHPAVRRGVDYLLRYQTTVSPPWDWQTPPKGAPTTGGWPFEPGNSMNPDFDSSQEVLSAIVLAREAGLRSRAIDDAITKCEVFLLAMQNPDGGWAAFNYGKPSQAPGPMFLPVRKPPQGYDWLGKITSTVSKVANTLIEYGDASTSDVTARMIWTLHRMGHSPSEPCLRDALALLEYQRDPGTGVWWGMWAVCFIPTTCYVLNAYAVMGVPADDPRVSRPADWLEEHQNSDGGWGETVAVFEDPSLAGRGQSMRAITAYAVWGLAASGRAHSLACRRGVEYLLREQQPDGLWSDTAPVGTLLPGVGYYSNTTFTPYFVLEALAAYREAVTRPQPSTAKAEQAVAPAP
ncbi:MAG: prenyltransferase/squalene oxidase repeat-containing protein [Polyangiaceae bacterium]